MEKIAEIIGNILEIKDNTIIELYYLNLNIPNSNKAKRLQAIIEQCDSTLAELTGLFSLLKNER